MSTKRTIIIEPVSNGWVVTERFPCRNTASEPLAVFNRLSELQDDLPMLLGLEAEPTEFITVGATNVIL